MTMPPGYLPPAERALQDTIGHLEQSPHFPADRLLVGQ